MYNRNPNTKCVQCGKEVYRRPRDIKKFNEVFCSTKCCGIKHRRKSIKCKNCNKEFHPNKTTTKFCSVECSNKNRTGSKYTKLRKGTLSQSRVNSLKEAFNFESCMVSGCRYNKTFDVHRLIEGKNGGKYEIGNMFAICPNHHAESHRGLITLEKINDYTLRAINIEANRSGLETNLES